MLPFRPVHQGRSERVPGRGGAPEASSVEDHVTHQHQHQHQQHGAQQQEQQTRAAPQQEQQHQYDADIADDPHAAVLQELRNARFAPEDVLKPRRLGMVFWAKCGHCKIAGPNFLAAREFITSSLDIAVGTVESGPDMFNGLSSSAMHQLKVITEQIAHVGVPAFYMVNDAGIVLPIIANYRSLTPAMLLNLVAAACKPNEVMTYVLNKYYGGGHAAQAHLQLQGDAQKAAEVQDTERPPETPEAPVKPEQQSSQTAQDEQQQQKTAEEQQQQEEPSPTVSLEGTEMDDANNSTNESDDESGDESDDESDEEERRQGNDVAGGSRSKGKKRTKRAKKAKRRVANECQDKFCKLKTLKEISFVTAAHQMNTVKKIMGEPKNYGSNTETPSGKRVSRPAATEASSEPQRDMTLVARWRDWDLSVLVDPPADLPATVSENVISHNKQEVGTVQLNHHSATHVQIREVRMVDDSATEADTQAFALAITMLVATSLSRGEQDDEQGPGGEESKESSFDEKVMITIQPTTEDRGFLSGLKQAGFGLLRDTETPTLVVSVADALKAATNKSP